jgi:hypothetical protein
LLALKVPLDRQVQQAPRVQQDLKVQQDPLELQVQQVQAALQVLPQIQMI